MILHKNSAGCTALNVEAIRVARHVSLGCLSRVEDVNRGPVAYFQGLYKATRLTALGLLLWAYCLCVARRDHGTARS